LRLFKLEVVIENFAVFSFAVRFLDCQVFVFASFGEGLISNQKSPVEVVALATSGAVDFR
jgi:hypothetical protein